MSGKVLKCRFDVRGIDSCIWKAFRFAFSGVRDGTCTWTWLRNCSGVGTADEITFVLFKRGKIVRIFCFEELQNSLLCKTSVCTTTLFQHLHLQTIVCATTLFQHLRLQSTVKWWSYSYYYSCMQVGRWWGIISSQFRRPHTPFYCTWYMFQSDSVLECKRWHSLTKVFPLMCLT